MKHRLLSLLLMLPCPASAGPEAIFNGSGLEGWKLQGAPYWSVVDGVLTGQSDHKMRNSILWTERSYKDFSVEVDFRFSGDIDSGIFLRHENEQIQIGTSRSLKRDMTGSPYIGSKRGYPQEASGVKDLLKPGDWNRMKIVAKGSAYSVSLNGSKVVEFVSETAKESGPVGLQVHPGVRMKIEFRAVTVESL
jgi:hypothetical protein